MLQTLLVFNVSLCSLKSNLGLYLFCVIENEVGDVLVQASKRNLVLLYEKERQRCK